MRRKIFSLVLAGLLFAHLTLAQTRKSEREHERLLGAVKAIRVENAKLDKKSDEWREQKRELKQVIEYNKAGNKTKASIYDETVKTLISYRYDEQGNRSESLFTDDGHQINDSSTRLGLPPRGVEKTDFVRWVFQYDQQGNRVGEVKSEGSGVPQGSGLANRWMHVYDENGHRIETRIYAKTGLLLKKSRYTNDEKGNPVEQIDYGLDDVLTNKWSYAYEFDAVGNWVKRTEAKWEERGAKSAYEPKEVLHRTITYY